MSRTTSAGSGTPSDSGECDACGGKIVDSFCEVCGLQSKAAQLEFDHYRIIGEETYRSTLPSHDHSRTAQAQSTDFNGQTVSRRMVQALNNGNRTDRNRRRYTPEERRDIKFNKVIKPHIHHIRSTEGGDEMMVSFKELYDALVGQSQVLARAKLRQKNSARTCFDQAMTSRVMAAVLVHELERDGRLLVQKLSDVVPFRYTTSKNTRNSELHSILTKVKTRWEEWSQHDEAMIRKYALTLLHHINGLYAATSAGDTLVRRDGALNQRNHQLEHMLNVVCQASSDLPNQFPAVLLDSVQSLLNGPDPVFERYPRMDRAPNHLITCQMEIVVHLLRHFFPEAKMKRTKVYNALKQGSNLTLPSSPNTLRTYHDLAGHVVSQLEESA